MRPWTDFTTAPGRAARDLHVSPALADRWTDRDLDAAIASAPRTPAPDDAAERLLARLEARAQEMREARALRDAERLRADRVAAGRGQRAVGPLSVIRQGLRDYLADNQELADAMGDLSLREGATGFAGLVGSLLAPLAIGTGGLGALSGAGLSILGDAVADEGARKVFGSSIQDPLAAGTFGAIAGAKGKAAAVLPAMATSLGVSSGDAEGALAKLRQLLYRGTTTMSGVGDALYASPQRSVGEYYARKRAAQTGGRPLLETLLVDPAAGRRYGHSLPLDRLNRDVTVTQARELSPEDVIESWSQLLDAE